MQYLHRDIATMPRILGQIDRGHAAPSELLLDSIFLFERLRQLFLHLRVHPIVRRTPKLWVCSPLSQQTDVIASDKLVHEASVPAEHR